ncbi:lplA [Symbiodinium sp. KB8]|nr:lplA [Symbiodinium sp. KB8]
MPGSMRYEWRLGKTPEFSHQFETRIDGVGVFDVNLKVVQGRIEEVTIFSDALFPDVISESMNVLKGVEYGKSSVSAVLAMLRMEFDEPGPLKTLDSLSQFMVSSIEE